MPALVDGEWAEEGWVDDELGEDVFPGSFGCAKEISAELESPGPGSEMG